MKRAKNILRVLSCFVTIAFLFSMVALYGEELSLNDVQELHKRDYLTIDKFSKPIKELRLEGLIETSPFQKLRRLEDKLIKLHLELRSEFEKVDEVWASWKSLPWPRTASQALKLNDKFMRIEVNAAKKMYDFYNTSLEYLNTIPRDVHEVLEFDIEAIRTQFENAIDRVPRSDTLNENQDSYNFGHMSTQYLH